MLPSEVQQLPASEFELLCRYWEEEPWGPWRDNLHAAIVARAVLQAGGYKATKIDAFMVRSQERASRELREAGKTEKSGVMNMLKTMAVRKKRVKP